MNEHLIRRLSQRIGLSVAKPVWRQIIAYKNLIEALENISIATILGLGFFITGSLNRTDYREFIRTNSLSQEHLLSAKHFLQSEYLLPEETELNLQKWYSEFATLVMNTVQHGNYFDNRHEIVYNLTASNSDQNGEKYLLLMEKIVIPKIEEFQGKIRNEIRFDIFCFCLDCDVVLNFILITSDTLELDMMQAKFMETTSLVLLLLVILLSPVIIFLVKNATSTIQVSNIEYFLSSNLS